MARKEKKTFKAFRLFIVSFDDLPAVRLKNYLKTLIYFELNLNAYY